MGHNFKRRHKQFKRYFAVQHPYLLIPDTCTRPNWKIDPFLEHLNKLSIKAVYLPEKISCTMNKQLVSQAKIPKKYESNTKRLVTDIWQIHCVSMETHTHFISVTSLHQKISRSWIFPTSCTSEFDD